MIDLSRCLGTALIGVAFSTSAAFALDQSKPADPLLPEEAACISAAAPLQYGGKVFNEIEARSAITACEAALAVSNKNEIKAYYARALEKDGRTTRARMVTLEASNDGSVTAQVAQADYLAKAGSINEATTPKAVLFPYLEEIKSAMEVIRWALLIRTIFLRTIIQMGAKMTGPKYIGKKPIPVSAARPTLPKNVHAVQ